MDALPQIPHDAVAMKWRSATDDASNGVARRTRIVSSGWFSSPGSPALGREDLGAGDEALGPEEPDGELVLVAGRAHRDRDGDRVLAGPGGPDLEGGFADDPVVAELERGAADGHDLGARHVADRLEAVVHQLRHVVVSSSRPSAVRASPAVPAASSARAKAARPSRPVPASAQAMNASAVAA